MIKIGVIGLGYWGPNIVRNFQSLPSCQVLMVADLSLENLAKIQESYPDLTTTQNYKDILKNQDIDAVAIVTPAVTHYHLIKDSLLAGKHVFAEKPMTINSKEGAELTVLAQKMGKVLMVGNTFEYNSSVIKAKEILNRGDLGRPLFIYFKKVSLGPIRSDVSVVWDFAYHDISILTYWLDQNPLGVSAKGKCFLKKGLEDLAFIDLEFPHSISAHIRVGWLYPVKERGGVIIGTEKIMVYDDLSKEKPLIIFDHQKFNWSSPPMITYPKVDFQEPLKVECQHFIDCIGKNKTPLTDGRRGVDIIKILEAIQKSLDSSGKWISLS